jgi:hypothetical protein
MSTRVRARSQVRRFISLKLKPDPDYRNGKLAAWLFLPTDLLDSQPPRNPAQPLLYGARIPLPSGGAARDRHGRWRRDVMDARAAQDERRSRVRRSRVVLISRCWDQVLQDVSQATVAKKPGHRGEFAK